MNAALVNEDDIDSTKRDTSFPPDLAETSGFGVLFGVGGSATFKLLGGKDQTEPNHASPRDGARDICEHTALWYSREPPTHIRTITMIATVRCLRPQVPVVHCISALGRHVSCITMLRGLEQKELEPQGNLPRVS